MNWKTVRLELGSSDAFPHGSAGRAFLLHVPIDSDGRIIRSALEQHPGRATVRRFWASEPDAFGTIEPMDGSWALQCGKGTKHNVTFLLDAIALKPDQQVHVVAPDGTRMPFRVANVRSALSR